MSAYVERYMSGSKYCAVPCVVRVYSTQYVLFHCLCQSVSYWGEEEVTSSSGSRKREIIHVSLQDGYTAMDAARDKGYTDITNLLKMYGHTH